MDTATVLSNFVASLLPRIKHYWQQSRTFSQNTFSLIARLFNTTMQTLKSIFNIILKQSNKAIDTLASHPLLDRIENRFQAIILSIKNTRQSILHEIRQSPYNKKVLLYIQLARLDKPIGILLLLWPTLIALWIAAQGTPDYLVLFVFVMGVILMRSAGCAINDYADRNIDGRVKRTSQRPLASGKISEKEALLVFSALSLTAFILVLLMNTLTIMMSVVGVLLAISYPFMKRYHYLPQVHLGAAFGWSAPMAYAAQAGEVTAITWLIFLATILWATAYDTMYAMVDYDDDIKIGVKSTAVLFGNQDKLIIGIIQILLILDLILIGHRAGLGGIYYTGVTAAAVFAAYQQYLIKDRNRERCFTAFLNNNWFGMVVFAGVLLDYQFSNMT